jgi:hypothetical protein
MSLFKTTHQSTLESAAYNNAEDAITDENFTKIRVGMTASNDFHRQILLGFMNQNATADFDPGYDGEQLEEQANDMYFMLNTTKLNIQGDGYFNTANSYPITLKTSSSGTVKIGIDGKENLDDSQNIYIYDSATNVYHDITTTEASLTLPAGTFANRFSLRFTNPSALGTNQNQLTNGITISYTKDNQVIIIKNESPDTAIKSVVLFNIIGQTITSWPIINTAQPTIPLPVSNLSTGAYIVKVLTDKGEITKKILVQQ